MSKGQGELDIPCTTASSEMQVLVLEGYLEWQQLNKVPATSLFSPKAQAPASKQELKTDRQSLGSDAAKCGLESPRSYRKGH